MKVVNGHVIFDYKCCVCGKQEDRRELIVGYYRCQDCKDKMPAVVECVHVCCGREYSCSGCTPNQTCFFFRQHLNTLKHKRNQSGNNGNKK